MRIGSSLTGLKLQLETKKKVLDRGQEGNSTVVLSGLNVTVGTETKQSFVLGVDDPNNSTLYVP